MSCRGHSVLGQEQQKGNKMTEIILNENENFDETTTSQVVRMEGIKNAVTTEELKTITGFDERTIRQHISNARLKGYVICSSLDSGGYFIPETPEEAAPYVRTEMHRIYMQEKALESALKYVSGE